MMKRLGPDEVLLVPKRSRWSCSSCGYTSLNIWANRNAVLECRKCGATWEVWEQLAALVGIENLVWR